MKASLLALGSSGARMAEAVLYCAFIGLLPHDDILHITLLHAPAVDAARLNRLFEAYAELRSVWGLRPHTGLQPILTLRVETDDAPLAAAADQAGTALLEALFTPEEMFSPAMAASPRSAAAAWAAALEAPRGALADALAEADAGIDTLVLGSAAEICGAGGIPLLLNALRTDRCPRIGAVLLTGTHAGEPADPAIRVLCSLPDLPFLCLIGLPGDCLHPQDGPHILHLYAVRGLRAFLEGRNGSFAFTIPEGKPDWRSFDPDGAEWGAGLDRLLQCAALWRCVYAPETLRSLRSPNLLRDRLNPWLNAYFLRNRLSDERRSAVLRHMEHSLYLLSEACGFLLVLQRRLPTLMHVSAPMAEARRAAEAHYEDLLRTAGRLALIRHDIAASGYAEESTVHRHDMADTDTEAALRSQTETEALLEQLEEEQRVLNEALGLRGVRSMLSAFRERAEEEASDVQSQAEAARVRIEQAAAIATPAEMPRVDQARAKLRRMERRLASLIGKRDQAVGDSEACMAQQPQPAAEHPETEAEEPVFEDVFWPDAWLSQLCALPDADPKTAQRQAQLLLSAWPWPQPLPQKLRDAVLRTPAPEDADPALALLDSLLAALSPARA